MFLEISLFILSTALLLIAFFSIPSLLQIRRTAAAIAVTLQALNDHLPGILRNLEEMTSQLNQATSAMNRQIEDLSHAFMKLQKTVNFLADLGQIVHAGLRLPFLNSLNTGTAIVKGVRVFLSILTSRPPLPGSALKK
jgi:uncharacterized protein YoxC